MCKQGAQPLQSFQVCRPARQTGIASSSHTWCRALRPSESMKKTFLCHTSACCNCQCSENERRQTAQHLRVWFRTSTVKPATKQTNLHAQEKVQRVVSHILYCFKYTCSPTLEKVTENRGFPKPAAVLVGLASLLKH